MANQMLAVIFLLKRVKGHYFVTELYIIYRDKKPINHWHSVIQTATTLVMN